mgnify:CR=1 FL=1
MLLSYLMYLLSMRRWCYAIKCQFIELYRWSVTWNFDWIYTRIRIFSPLDGVEYQMVFMKSAKDERTWMKNVSGQRPRISLMEGQRAHFLISATYYLLRPDFIFNSIVSIRWRLNVCVCFSFWWSWNNLKCNHNRIAKEIQIVLCVFLKLNIFQLQSWV